MKVERKIKRLIDNAIKLAEPHGGEVQAVQRVLEALCDLAKWDWMVLALCNLAMRHGWKDRASKLHEALGVQNGIDDYLRPGVTSDVLDRSGD